MASSIVGLVPRANRPVRRVALVIANLGWGGAQKVMISMANHWVQQGWQVTLLSMDAEVVPSYFPVHPAVAVVHLGVSAPSPTPWRALQGNVRRLTVLRRAISDSRPDVVISFLSATNILVLLATRFLGLPVVVSERGDPARAHRAAVWRLLRSLVYPTAYRLVVQTETALAHFPRIVRRRGLVLPNPVTMRHQDDPFARKAVVAVGHLVPVKGFDLLIEAFAQCAGRHQGWRLVVWGEGPERATLHSLAERLGVVDRVEFPGRSAIPGGWVEMAAIFVLASRHEGFPNVLVEAMAAGLPVVATDCPAGGPRAMLSDGVDGLLVANESVAALGAALDRLMADPQLCRRLGEAASLSAERYSSPKIMERWTALVEEAAATKRDRRGAPTTRPAVQTSSSHHAIE